MIKEIDISKNLKLVVVPMAERESASVGVWFGSGGRYEQYKYKGIAHFLEHMVFKGSKKYSREEIKQVIEGFGGKLNAFTSQEMTCFYAQVLPQYIEKTLDVLLDMAINPLFPNDELEREKYVVMEEIKMYEDLPHYRVQNYLNRILWPSTHLGTDLIGTFKTVAGIDRGVLKQFHSKHYHVNNMAIVVTGAVDTEDIIGIVKRQVKGKSGIKKPGFKKLKDIKVKDRLFLSSEDTEQAHLAMGFLGLSAADKDRFVMGLLSVIMGENMSSRLFVKIREDKGLAYHISSYVKGYLETGAFKVAAGINDFNLPKTIDCIVKEFNRIKKTPPGAKELKRAKEFLLGQILMELENVSEYMVYLGTSLFYFKDIPGIEAMKKEISSVTAKQISALANKIFKDRNCRLAVIGKGLDNYENKVIKSLSALL